MQETLNNLDDNLRRQARLYSQLNDLALRKQKALILSELSEIEQTTKQEEKLLLEVSMLEKQRLLWAEKISLAMGKAPEELTLAELAEHFPQLQEVRTQLEEIIPKLADTHELNTKLLEQAMQVVNLTVDMLTQPEEMTYGSKGKSSPGSGLRNLIDRSI